MLSLCEIYISVDDKLDVLNKNLVCPIDGRDCLAELSICSPPSLACYDRECEFCGIDIMKIFLSICVLCDLCINVNCHLTDE